MGKDEDFTKVSGKRTAQVVIPCRKKGCHGRGCKLYVVMAGLQNNGSPAFCYTCGTVYVPSKAEKQIWDETKKAKGHDKGSKSPKGNGKCQDKKEKELQELREKYKVLEAKCAKNDANSTGAKDDPMCEEEQNEQTQQVKDLLRKLKELHGIPEDSRKYCQGPEGTHEQMVEKLRPVSKRQWQP